ncbi:MAG TPA: hypothetical protein VNF99_04150 [Stellaceae bacterium]|nr:hypothetical protein [Stellaceae bacterium]
MATIKSDVVALKRELDDVRRQSLDVVGRRIGEQPLQSMLIAAAVGFVCSRLLAHRLF